MWPFKENLNTECCSGMVTCDGKHHKWAHWETITLDGMVYSIFNKSGTPITVRKQRHRCIVCNFIEEKEL